MSGQYADLGRPLGSGTSEPMYEPQHQQGYMPDHMHSTTGQTQGQNVSRSNSLSHAPSQTHQYSTGHSSNTAYSPDEEHNRHLHSNGINENGQTPQKTEDGREMLNVNHPENVQAKAPEGHLANNLAPAAGAVGAVAPLEKGGPGGEKMNGTNPGGPGGPPGNAAGGGPPGGKPKLDKFAYGFWAPQMAPFRKIVFKILGPVCVLSILVMWACLPLYWGSLWKADRYTDRLTVRVINRDGNTIGNTVSEQLLNVPNLKYFVTSPSDLPTEQDVIHDIVQEGAWAAVVINSDATTNLANARSSGTSSYNGSRAIDIYFATSRNEQAIGSYLRPMIQAAMGQITAQLSAQSIAQYLQQNTGETAITNLAKAPTTVTNSIFYTMNDVRPYNQPVANAITLVGLIYMLIFAFIITMTNNAVREIIAPFLTTKSYIMYRIFTPLLLYLPISFFFSMVNLPFKVHFGAHYNYAAGFFLWAFTLYLGMASVGLATEFAITILGPKFMAFFLIPLIIVNVSVAVLPHELQPWIYRYGAAMPFYNVGRVVRTIIFNTKNEIAMHLGILLAWIALSLITIPLATWLFRRNSVNAHRKAVAESEMDRTLPPGDDEPGYH